MEAYWLQTLETAPPEDTLVRLMASNPPDIFDKTGAKECLNSVDIWQEMMADDPNFDAIPPGMTDEDLITILHPGYRACQERCRAYLADVLGSIRPMAALDDREERVREHPMAL